MAKYLVETYYTCNFKVSHYLDEISEAELSNLDKRNDGKFEILDVKLENRKTKNWEAAHFFPYTRSLVHWDARGRGKNIKLERRYFGYSW